MSNTSFAKWLLRIGIAFVYVYAAVEIYLHPDNFLKYVPKVILDYVQLDLFLLVFGVLEIVLSVWLLSGWKGHYSSIISVVMIAGIVVFNPEYFQILFRNVAIGFGGLALLVLELRKNKEEKMQKLENHTTKLVTQKPREGMFDPSIFQRQVKQYS
jgi:hypothetical protein